MPETLDHETVRITDNQVVHDYANDLSNLLANSSITEQRSFLQSSVNRIKVNDAEVEIYYTILGLKEREIQVEDSSRGEGGNIAMIILAEEVRICRMQLLS